jgi:hypothetical protein
MQTNLLQTVPAAPLTDRRAVPLFLQKSTKFLISFLRLPFPASASVIGVIDNLKVSPLTSGRRNPDAGSDVVFAGRRVVVQVHRKNLLKLLSCFSN